MKVSLVTVDCWAPPIHIDLVRFPAVLGSGADVAVRIQDSWTSPRHCEIALVDDELQVRDLESKRGILVNDRQVAYAALKPGDRLTIGVRMFVVSYKMPARRNSKSGTKASPVTEATGTA